MSVESETTKITSEVDEKILYQLEYVRRGGHCNMLDRICVGTIADNFDFEELSGLCNVDRSDQRELALEGRSYAQVLMGAQFSAFVRDKESLSDGQIYAGGTGEEVESA